MHVVPTFAVAGFYLGPKPDPDAPRMRMLPRDVRAAWEVLDFRLETMTDALRALAETAIAPDRAALDALAERLVAQGAP